MKLKRILLSVLLVNGLAACATNQKIKKDSQDNQVSDKKVAPAKVTATVVNVSEKKQVAQNLPTNEVLEIKVKGGKIEPVKQKTKASGFTYRFIIREVPDRKVAAVSSSIKSGMHTVDTSCQIKTKPTGKSKTSGFLPKGKKVWAEPHGKNWAKVYRKKGTGYVPSVCL